VGLRSGQSDVIFFSKLIWEGDGKWINTLYADCLQHLQSNTQYGTVG
jgi:hypothetical protein